MAAQIDLLTKSDISKLSVIYGKQNVLPWTYYDSLSVANGNALTKFQFFSRTRGADGIAVTNMEAANQLISGKLFVLESIQLDVNPLTGIHLPGSLNDMTALTESRAAFTLKINQVEYAQGLVKELTGGMFGYAAIPDVGGATQYATPRIVKPYKLDPAVVIPTQTNFTLEFEYAAAINPAATQILRPKLCGKLIRLTSA